MKILIIIGNSECNSFTHAMAESYKIGALKSKHDVKEINIAKLNINSDFTKEILFNKPDMDVLESQRLIVWADKLVFFYPIWWGTMPSMMKAWIERVFLSGFAFKFTSQSKWDKKLAGKSAHIFVTMDTPVLISKLMLGSPNTKLMRKAILGFCGIEPVKISEFSPITHSTQKQREVWLQKINKIAMQ